MHRLPQLFTTLAFFAVLALANSANAGTIVSTHDMVARQQVNLLGIDAVLVARGPVTFTFDVDVDGNTVPGGGSNMSSLFKGFLPDEFAPLRVNGFAFDLYSLDPAIVVASNNGTHVSAATKFGLRVFAAPGVALAEFFTTTNSIFASDVPSLLDFSGAVFRDDNPLGDITGIFIGPNFIGVPENAPVGVSFNRTVTPVPEPSTLLIGLVAAATCVRRRRRK